MSDLSRVWLSCLDPLVYLLPNISNLLIMGVPDDGYSRNASFALNSIYTFLLLSLSRYLSW